MLEGNIYMTVTFFLDYFLFVTLENKTTNLEISMSHYRDKEELIYSI